MINIDEEPIIQMLKDLFGRIPRKLTAMVAVVITIGWMTTQRPDITGKDALNAIMVVAIVGLMSHGLTEVFGPKLNTNDQQLTTDSNGNGKEAPK